MAIRTVDDLNDYMKIHGNTRLGEFELNDKLIECVKELNEIEFNPVKELNLHYITKSRMKKNAKEFLTQFYQFWNVGYLPDSKLKRIIKWKKISCEGEIISLYNAAAKMIDPFKLPIKYDKDNVFDGRLVTQVLYRSDTANTDYLKDLKLYFQRIELPRRTTELSTSSYIHEITHAILETYKGLTQEYYNAEVFPIFNELLYAYNSNPDMFDVLFWNRLNNIYNSFNNIYEFKNGDIDNKEYYEFDYHSDVKYLTSTLKAFQLLSMYIESIRPIDSYVTHQIGRSMLGFREVEKVLTDVGVIKDSYVNPEFTKKIIKTRY